MGSLKTPRSTQSEATFHFGLIGSVFGEYFGSVFGEYFRSLFINSYLHFWSFSDISRGEPSRMIRKDKRPENIRLKYESWQFHSRPKMLDTHTDTFRQFGNFGTHVVSGAISRH